MNTLAKNVIILLNLNKLLKNLARRNPNVKLVAPKISHESMVRCFQLLVQGDHQLRALSVGDVQQHYHAQVVTKVESDFTSPMYGSNKQ